MTACKVLLLPTLIQSAVAVVQPWSPNYAFVSTLPSKSTVTTPPLSTTTSLHASKSTAARKKKNKPAKRGGFGNTAPSKQKPKKDAIFYPELESQVLKTLVPSPIDNVENDELMGSVLSEEMYDRLEDIYGLPKFNFGGDGAIYKSIGSTAESDASGGSVEEEDSGSSLFDDILSGGSSQSQSNNNALDDLLSPSLSSAPISLDDIMESKSDNAKENQSSPSKTTFDLNNIPAFDKFRVLHTDPMVLAIDDFFTNEECDEYVQMSLDSESSNEQSTLSNLQPMLLGKSQTVGKDSRSQAQRTSTTWFHYYQGVPELMAKASRLLGLESINRWEEPQTVRYRRNEKFTWHLDALSPEEATNEKGAGQRVATLLVYLTELTRDDGGATMFRDLGGDDGPLKV